MRRRYACVRKRCTHFFFLLLVCFSMPAGADTVSDLPFVDNTSDDTPISAGTAPDSDATSDSQIHSESILPPISDELDGQDPPPEAAETMKENLPFAGCSSLCSGLGKVVQRGLASWYGPGFHGRKSANGERFNMYSMTAAHPSLPLQSWVLVRNVHNNKVALVKVTDRGPYHGKRILDVSYAVAKQLGFLRNGTAQVELRSLSRSEVGRMLPSSLR